MPFASGEKGKSDLKQTDAPGAERCCTVKFRMFFFIFFPANQRLFLRNGNFNTLSLRTTMKCVFALCDTPFENIVFIADIAEISCSAALCPIALVLTV